MNKENVVKNIKERYSELYPAEKKVADYILSHVEEVVMLNVTDLATKSETSEATVVRTCKHLDYDGYYQMRILLSHDIGKRENANEKKELGTSQAFFGFQGERVKWLAEYIKTETLLNVSKILMTSRNTHIVGVGNTIPIVMDLGFRLERYGVPCTYSMIPEHFYNHIALGSSQDSVVAISRTSASTQVIRAVEIARKKGMKVIAVIGELNKQITENADEIIRVVENGGSEYTVAKPDSHLLEMAVNDAILYSVKNYKQISDDIARKQAEKENIDVLLSEFKL